MNDIQVAAGAPAVFLHPGFAGTKPNVPSGSASLLPEPQSPSDDDAIAGLLALESRSRNLSLSRGIRNIQSLRQERRVEWEKQKASVAEAARAQEESSFWGSVGEICGVIGKVAAVVTSAAVAVSTGGAGLPFVLAVAGACLSATALAQGEFEILQELGVDAETSAWIELGMGIGGVACTGTAAIFGGAAAATQAQKVASTAEKISTAAAGGTTIVAGVAIRRKYAADVDAEERYADAASSHLEETRLDRMFARILDDLEESEKSYRQTTRLAKGAMEMKDSTLLLSIRRN